MTDYQLTATEEKKLMDRIKELERALEEVTALGKYWQARAIKAEETISGITLASVSGKQDK